MTPGLHNLQNPGRPSRKRLGRGTGTGLGTTAGRGTKGQNARSGGGVRPQFEGGHTPLYRLLPKLRGFRSRFAPAAGINVGQLEANFAANAKVNRGTLRAKKLVGSKVLRIKLLGAGELKKPLIVSVDLATAQAKQKVEAAGGKLLLHKPRERASAPKSKAEPTAKS